MHLTSLLHLPARKEKSRPNTSMGRKLRAGSMAGIQLVYTEKDIEDILASNCQRLLAVKFVTRQYRTSAGIIDIIAKSLESPDYYYIIEIKKDALDASAYVQARRYARWMNREESKSGKRKFLPVIIGEQLHSSLHGVCDYFEPDSLGLHLLAEVRYRLFGFDVLEGINFSYSSREQERMAEKLEHRHCHISTLEESHDYLTWSLERDNG